jgi:hypothetical protein
MVNYTNIQKIIEGCLLGDGHLELPKKGKNATFNYRTSSKQHAEFVHSFFKDLCTNNYQNIKTSEIFDVRTNKTYINYFFKTKSLPIFTEQHKRFYLNKTKVVPSDLIIDNNVLLFWYIGDGELQSKGGFIKLHTNSFSYDEVTFLRDKLSLFDAKTYEKVKNQYILTIPRKKVKDFFNMIGECPIPDYTHKWLLVKYKNKNIEENGMKSYKDLLPLIVEDFIKNGDTLYQLHKKYNVPIKSIKHHFNHNNIKWVPKDCRKKILQCDINGNIIKEWDSASEIEKELKFSQSAIGKCCKSIRKTHNGFIWKYKN